MFEHALPEWVDANRVSVSNTLDPVLRKQLGQFMTPAGVARFMASMFTHRRKSVRLLDAGAGMGSLSAAYVDSLRNVGSRAGGDIEVTAVEIDALLCEYLQSTLDNCAERCRSAGIGFKSRLIGRDFMEYAVDEAVGDGLLDARRLARFDAAILNPPYAKINVNSSHRRLLRLLGIEATNLYSAFMAVAIRMLKPGGQLVAITPRSFCNGPYFRQFRQMLVTEMSLRQIHIYESRKDAFRDDAVLQENVILHAVKSAAPPSSVRITTSSSARHIDLTVREVPYSQVVRARDPEAFIHVTTSDADDCLAELVLRQPRNLAALGLNISTGRVVDFRAREHLRQQPAADSVPLIYPAHFHEGFVKWPRADGRKPNAIFAGPATDNLMASSGTYVLTKRFTSKEERRRVVAAIYDPERVGGSFSVVGLENHLNYFHADGQGLEPQLARGLAAYLNTTAVDRYFRQFSGHTQVNATDLRSLRYPDASTLRRMARKVGDRINDQVSVDAAATSLLG